MEDLTKDQVDELITDCLHNKRTLEELLRKLNLRTTIVSDLDYVYIENNYSSLLIELWLKEVPEHIGILCNPNNILEAINTLNSIQELGQCFEVLDQSEYYVLFDQFRKSSKHIKIDEIKCIARFKRACLFSVHQHADLVKCEISFIEHVISMFKFSQDPDQLCSEIYLREFLSKSVLDETSVKQFLLNLQKCDNNDWRFLNLKHLSCELLNVSKYYLFDELKNTVNSYLKQPVVTESLTDGRKVIEVSGKHIVLSKVLTEIESEPRFPQVEEVRFVNADAIHVDADFKLSVWHSKNIVVYCNTLIVDSSRLFIWNVSGKDGAMSGASGNPGEGGGNVLIIVDHLVNGQGLRIISNGGNGKNGHKGKNGMDGKDGHSLSSFEFSTKFPPVSKLVNSEKRSRLKTTYENVADGLLRVEDLNLENIHIGPIDIKTFKMVLETQLKTLENIYFVVTKEDFCKITFSFSNEYLSPCQSFLLLNGSPGSEGEAGGQGGIGGSKGAAGDIDFHITQNHNNSIKTVACSGILGSNGLQGDSGKCGKSGLDHAYMDYSISLRNEWPKLITSSKNDNFTLEVGYMKESNGNCVYTPHNNKYAQIIFSNKDTRKDKSFSIRFSLSSESWSQSAENRKKTICLEKIVNQYNQKITGANMTEMLFSLETANAIIEDISANDVSEVEQTAEETTVKRISKMALKFKKRFFSNWIKDQQGDIFQESKLEDVSELLKLVEKCPKDINNWNNLFRARLDFKQLNKLWTVALTLRSDLMLNQLVEHLCDKLKLTCLDLINTQHLPNLLLQCGKEDDSEPKSGIYAWLETSQEGYCQRAIEYFCDDSHEKRLEFKIMCASICDDRHYNLFKNAVKTFIIECGSSIKDSIEVTELFHNKKDFECNKQYVLEEKLEPVKNLLLATKDVQLYKLLIESFTNNITSFINLHEAILLSSDEFLKKCYRIYCKEVQNDFDWADLEDIDGMVKNGLTNSFHRFVEETGPFAKPYREFLAYYFDIAIFVYSINEVHNKIILVDSHNPKGKKQVHLLIKGREFVPLNLDNTTVCTDGQTETEKLCHKVLVHVDTFTDIQEFDEFITRKPFISADYDGVDKSTELKIKIHNILAQDDDLQMIQTLYSLDENKVLLNLWLDKLKLQYVGNVSFLYYIALHLKLEGAIISAIELCFIINFLLRSVLSQTNLVSKLSWIISAHHQTSWIVEITLLKLELHLKTTVEAEVKYKWREYLSNLKEKDSLMLFLNKLGTAKIHETCNIISAKYIGEVLFLMCDIPKYYVGLNDIDICEWKFYLKDRYWIHQLSKVTDWKKIELSSISYLLSMLDNLFGMDKCIQVVDVLIQHKNEISEPEKVVIENILSVLCTAEISISEKLIDTLSKSKICKWKEVLKTNQKPGEERNALQLVRLMEESKNTSGGVLNMLPNIEKAIAFINSISCLIDTQKTDRCQMKQWTSRLLKLLHTSGRKITLISTLYGHFSELAGLVTSIINLKSYDDSSILQCLSSLQSTDTAADKKYILECILLATVFSAIKMVLKITLRDAQKLAILTFLMSNRNILGQVSTGEGKSLIVVSVSIIKALITRCQVDVITSSHVLAQRDAGEYSEIYQLFELSAGHNCHADLDERKEAYSNCQVVYGELASFQRDFLLDRFYSKNVMGDRKFESIIVDEVDSMLLDQSSNMLYLSHDIPGLDKLEIVFVYIWKWLNLPGKNNKKLPSAQQLKESILFGIFGWLRKDDIRNLDSVCTETQVELTWKFLINVGVISGSGELLKGKIENNTFEGNNCIPVEHIRYLLAKVVDRNKQLDVPNHLKQFVKDHLDEWIQSAVTAMSMVNDRDYVVGFHRSSSNQDCNPNIIILDHDTGTDLANSHWDKGLHQFLQLKHGCRLSLISLKAVFMSNVSYFKCYKTLYGLTGTLGSKQERELLQNIYEVDFVTIPTAKPKSFTVNAPFVCTNPQDWADQIVEKVTNISLHRSVLIICESICDVKLFEEKFKNHLSTKMTKPTVHCYKRDYEKLDVVNNLEPGHIIISTNLAGRGTDIKLSKELVLAGGLHVCLSFLPSNCRIEEQAYGRVARNGVPGSAQLIFKNLLPKTSDSSIIDLKKQRDLNEYIRIEEIQMHYETKIHLEEIKFKEFKDGYMKLKDKIEDSQPEDRKTILLQESLDQWAFWLDSNSKNLGTASIQVFLEHISEIGDKNISIWIEKVQNPSHLIKLGLIYFKHKDFKSSILCFDKALEKEPHFSGVAHYYSVLTRSMSNDFTKDDVVVELLKAKTQLKKQIDTLLVNTYIVDMLKEVTKSIIQYDSFKKQQENIIKIYQVYQESIDNVLGCNIPYRFIFHENVLSEFVKKEVVLKHHISSSFLLEDLHFAKDYELEPQKLFLFLKAQGNSKFVLNQFVKACPLPSRELLWKELAQNNILVDEEEYILFDFDQLQNNDPSLKNKIKPLAVGVQPKLINQVWLYQQDEMGNNWGKTFYSKHKVRLLVGEKRMSLLEEKELFITNKRATFTCSCEDQYNLSFDLISVDEFKKVGIGVNVANSILDELVEMKIVTENEIENKRVFSLRIKEAYALKDLELSRYKGYSEDVKGLLIFHFAFNLALKKLSNQLSVREELTMPLQINPHKMVVCKLIEHEIVKSIVNKKLVEKGKEYKKVMQSLFDKERNKDSWGELFNEIYDSAYSLKIIAALIESNVLIPCSSFRDTDYYEINSDKIETEMIWGSENMPPDITEETETIKLILRSHFNKSREYFDRCLVEAQGLIVQVNRAGFSLTPLADCLQKLECPTSEIGIFSLNGFDQVLRVGEMKWTWKMKLSTCVTCMLGIAQIGVGAVLTLSGVGLLLGEKLVIEGANDLAFSLSCFITGIFSWKDYLMNKGISIMMSFASNLLKLGSFFFGKKTMSSLLTETATAVKGLAGAAFGTSKKEAMRDILVTVVKTVGFGVMHTALPQLIDPEFEKVSKLLTELFNSNIDKALIDHGVTISIEQLYSTFGEKKCQDIIKTALSEEIAEYQSKRNSLWEETVDKAIKSLMSALLIFPGINTQNGEMSAESMKYLVLLIKNVTKLARSFKKDKFKEVYNIVFMFLSALNKRLQMVLNEIRGNGPGLQELSGENNKIKNDESLLILEKVKQIIKEDLSQFLHVKVVLPFCSVAADFIVSHCTSLPKPWIPDKLDKHDSQLLLFKNEEFDNVIKTKEESSKNDTERKDLKLCNVVTFLGLEYEDSLIKLLEETGNHQLFVEIVRKNCKAENCLELCCTIILAVLKVNGINIPDIQINVLRNGICERYRSTAACGQHCVTVYMSVNESNDISSIHKNICVQDVFDAVCKVLPESYPEFKWNSEKMLEEVLNAVEKDDNVKKTITFYYKNRTKTKVKNVHETRAIKHTIAYQHNHPNGKWTFNPVLDVDICKELDENEHPASKTSSHIQAGLNAALDKVNTHIYKVQKHLIPLFKLTLEDFNTIEFEIVTPTKSASKTPFQALPVHYELTMPFRIEGRQELVPFIVSLRLRNNFKITPFSPCGPHIFYEIEPLHAVKCMSLGVKGHVLLNGKCKSIVYSAEHCHTVGELILFNGHIIPYRVLSKAKRRRHRQYKNKNFKPNKFLVTDKEKS